MEKASESNWTARLFLFTIRVPESYISANDNIVRSFSEGFGRGAQMEHEDYALHKQSQQNAFREQMLQERLNLQYRNSLALNAVKFAQKAEMISSLTSQKAAVMQNTELKKGAIAIINDQIKQYKPWASTMRGNIKNAPQIDTFLSDAEQRKLAIEGIGPGNGNNGFIDKNAIASLTQPKVPVQPEFTEAYQKYLSNKPKLQDAQIANYGSEVDRRSQSMTSSGDKAAQKDADKFNNDLYHFQAGFNATVAAGKPYQDLYDKYGGDFTKLRQSDPLAAAKIPDVIKATDKAKQAFVKNPRIQGFLDKLQNPAYVPDDIAQFVVHYKGQFGNLSSWDDVQKFWSFLKTQKRDGDDAHKKVASALDNILSGNTALLPETPEETPQQPSTTQPSAADYDGQINSVANEEEPENPYDDNTGN